MPINDDFNNSWGGSQTGKKPLNVGRHSSNAFDKANDSYELANSAYDLGISAQTASYHVTRSDRDKIITISSGNVHINTVSTTFYSGFRTFIYNNTAATMTVVPNTGTTLYFSNTNTTTTFTGTRTLTPRALAVIYCVAGSGAGAAGANTFIITGQGIT